VLIPAAAAERPERVVGGTKASLLLIVVGWWWWLGYEKCVADGFESIEVSKEKKKYKNF